MKRKLGSLLVVVAGLLLALSRWLDPGSAGRAPQQGAPRVERPAPAGDRLSPPDARSGGLDFTGDSERDTQIARVVTAMDQTGQPPAGVAQGGRRGGPQGVFDNRQASCPGAARATTSRATSGRVAPAGAAPTAWSSDASARSTTPDHYRTFTRLR